MEWMLLNHFRQKRTKKNPKKKDEVQAALGNEMDTQCFKTGNLKIKIKTNKSTILKKYFLKIKKVLFNFVI